jgi:hypothetical protein
MVVCLTSGPNTDEFTIDGKEFTWEEGGEHDSRFMMEYSDPQNRFEIIIEFETEGDKIFNYSISTSGPVRVVEDELEVPRRFLNYDPDTF